MVVYGCCVCRKWSSGRNTLVARMTIAESRDYSRFMPKHVQNRCAFGVHTHCEIYLLSVSKLRMSSPKRVHKSRTYSHTHTHTSIQALHTNTHDLSRALGDCCILHGLVTSGLRGRRLFDTVGRIAVRLRAIAIVATTANATHGLSVGSNLTAVLLLCLSTLHTTVVEVLWWTTRAATATASTAATEVASRESSLIATALAVVVAALLDAVATITTSAIRTRSTTVSSGSAETAKTTRVGVLLLFAAGILTISAALGLNVLLALCKNKHTQNEHKRIQLTSTSEMKRQSARHNSIESSRHPPLTSSGVPAIAEFPLIGRIRAAANGLAEGRGDVGRLVALLADDHVELDHLSVAHGTHGLLRVVAHDGCLVHKHVLVCVVTVDEAVAVLHVEPFHGTDDLGSCLCGWVAKLNKIQLKHCVMN